MHFPLGSIEFLMTFSPKFFELNSLDKFSKNVSKKIVTRFFVTLV